MHTPRKEPTLNGDAGQPFDVDSFVRDHDARLRRAIRTRIPANSELDDVVQLVYLKLWARRERIRDAAEAFTWCRIFARDVIIEHHRAADRRPVTVGLGDDDPVAHRADAAEDSTESLRQLLDLLRTALGPRQAEVFVLREFEGLTNDEIARRLGISPSAASNAFTRAWASLRKAQLFRHLAAVPVLAVGRTSQCARNYGALLGAAASWLATLTLIVAGPITDHGSGGNAAQRPWTTRLAADGSARRPAVPPLSPAPRPRLATSHAADTARPAAIEQVAGSSNKIRCLPGRAACLGGLGDTGPRHGHVIWVEGPLGRTEVWQDNLRTCDVVELLPDQDLAGCTRYEPAEPLSMRSPASTGPTG